MGQARTPCNKHLNDGYAIKLCNNPPIEVLFKIPWPKKQHVKLQQVSQWLHDVQSVQITEVFARLLHPSLPKNKRKSQGFHNDC